jgi:molybdate transport system permease protein
MLIPDLSPLWVSLKVSLLATAITFGLGTAVAYKMYGYRGKARSLIEGILIAPLVLPPTVVGFVLLILLGKNGILGQILTQLHLSIVFTWYAAVLAAVIVSFPLMYRSALGAFEQIDSLLLDAARLDGSSEIEVFWYMALPLALSGILAGTVLTFARALGEFGATLMLAGNIPGQTQTIPMAVYFAVEAGTIQEGWFWTIIVVFISLVGIIIVNSWKV